MSTIEPTEEQLQKGEQMYGSSDYMTSRDFAEILAEREAALLAEIAALTEENKRINDDVGAAARIARRGWDDLAKAVNDYEHMVAERNSVQGDLDVAHAEVKALKSFVENEAERDCAYGDSCPNFSGSRHGTCTGCRARRALEQLSVKVPE